MLITKSSHGQVAALVVQGQLNATTAPLLERELRASIETGATRFIVDFGGVQLISSAALRVLLSAAKQMKKQQGQILLCALTPTVSKVFEVSGLAGLFGLHPDLAAALAALGIAEAPAAAAERAPASGRGEPAAAPFASLSSSPPRATTAPPVRLGGDSPYETYSPARVAPPPNSTPPFAPLPAPAAAPPPRASDAAPSATVAPQTAAPPRWPMIPSPVPASMASAPLPRSSAAPTASRSGSFTLPPPVLTSTPAVLQPAAPVRTLRVRSKRGSLIAGATIGAVILIGLGALAVFLPHRSRSTTEAPERMTPPAPLETAPPTPVGTEAPQTAQRDGASASPTVEPALADAAPPEAGATPSPVTPPAGGVRPALVVDLDSHKAENSETRRAVLARIEIMSLSAATKDRLYREVDTAHGLGKILAIGFDSGQTDLSATTIASLKKALVRSDIQSLASDPATVFVVLGFADGKGAAQKNREVSERRAESTKTALRGPCRIGNVIYDMGMGGSAFLGKENAAKNRIVEVWVVLP